MLRISFKSNFHKLNRLYQHELQEYILFNRRATIKLLFFAIPLLLISISLFTLGSTKHHIIPWHIISGIVSLYFVARAIIYQADSFGATNRTNTEVDLYLAKIERSKSISYQLSEVSIECYLDDRLEYITKWNELNAVVERERYFCLFFNKGKNIFVPGYAVRTKLYKEFLNQANKNIKHPNTKTAIKNT